MLSIKGGSPREDVVDDIDLELIADLQAEEWQIQQKLQRAVNVLESRILHGATVQTNRFYFDRNLRMVRSKKEEKAGG